MVKILSISKNSFIESIRQPEFCIILASGAAIIATSPLFAVFALMNSEKLIMDMGLATIMLGGVFVAAFSASSTISREIEDKTVLTIISKPVSRLSFIAGKFIGILAALLAYSYIMILFLLLTARMGAPETAMFKTDWPVIITQAGGTILIVLIGFAANYFFDKPFTSTTVFSGLIVYSFLFLVSCFFGRSLLEIQSFGKGIDLELLKACVVCIFSILILGAVSITISTRFNPVVNISACFCIFILGLLSDYFFGRYAGEVVAARIMYTVTPNFQLFWLADALTAEMVIPLSYVYTAAGYTITYVLALICISFLLFADRDFS